MPARTGQDRVRGRARVRTDACEVRVGWVRVRGRVRVIVMVSMRH